MNETHVHDDGHVHEGEIEFQIPPWLLWGMIGLGLGMAFWAMWDAIQERRANTVFAVIDRLAVAEPVVDAPIEAAQVDEKPDVQAV